jgi:hypothetical protein
MKYSTTCLVVPLRWGRASHERVQFVKGALAMVDMLADDSDAKKHRDLRRTEIEKSEANVVKVAEANVGFINPFEMEQQDKLYCISSGASATSNKSVAPGWDISIFAKNTQKNVRYRA